MYRIHQHTRTSVIMGLGLPVLNLVGATPVRASDVNNGDLDITYLAFHSITLRDGENDGASEFQELLNSFITEENPDGYGNPNGYVRFGLHYHFNPVSSKFFKLKDGATPPYKFNDFAFRPGVVGRNLDEAVELFPQSHISISIMAGHCYESDFARYLNDNPERNFMRNQYDEPVEFSEDEECSSIYPFTPATLEGHRSLYLEAFLHNSELIMEEVAAWGQAHPDTVIAGIGVGGPTVFPRGVGNKKSDTRWADYRDDFVQGFRNYAFEMYGGDFATFLVDMGIPDGVFADFSELDPPRFEPLSVNPNCSERMPGCVQRGEWDLLGDLNNPYFALWYEYRAFEITQHYRTLSELAIEAGLGGYYLYSHQGVAWEDGDSYLVKGSSLSTIDPMLTGLQPGLNLYDEKTGDYERIKALRKLSCNGGGKAGSASFQYNPGGPCEIIRREDGTKERICSEEGYPVKVYLERLYMAGGRGDVPRPKSRFRLLLVMGDDKVNEDAIRLNMREAIKRYLSGDTALLPDFHDFAPGSK